MLVLAIDTCLSRCAVCLFDSAQNCVLAEEHQDLERGHAEILAPMVKRVLAAAGKTPSEVSRVAVTVGPGTFTGLRIGLSFARAFGLARRIPVVGLDTLHAFRLCTDENKPLALSIGQSGLAYVLRPKSDEIELVPIDQLMGVPLLTGFPELKALASWAAVQTVPVSMPEPVYIREADAKLQVVVKQVDADEAATLSTIHQSAFSESWSAADFAAMFSIAGTQAFVAEVASDAAGMALTRTIAGQAEILSIATLPSRRRTGVAAKLLGKVIECSKALRAQTLFLEVAQSNVAARGLYVKAGFSESGRRKAYYANGDDAIVMSRSLV